MGRTQKQVARVGDEPFVVVHERDFVGSRVSSLRTGGGVCGEGVRPGGAPPLEDAWVVKPFTTRASSPTEGAPQWNDTSASTFTATARQSAY